MPAVLVSGSSGFVASHLIPVLKNAGFEVRRLLRTPDKSGGSDPVWNPKTGELISGSISDLEAVIHLAGAGIADKRWSKKRKFELRESRVEVTGNLVKLLTPARPKIFLSASAVGIYGDRADEILTEESPPGKGFLAELGQAWEAEARKAETIGARVVLLRFGVILSPDGGMLKKLLPIFKLCGGGALGSGQQYFSWVMLADVLAAILFVLQNHDISGPVNITAPNPVTNLEFTRELGATLNRPTPFTVPRFLMRVMVGDLADEALLSSQRVLPKRLDFRGFNFQHPKLGPALRAAC